MPVKALLVTDVVKVSIGKVVFLISPLKREHKFEIIALRRNKAGDVVENLEAASRLYLKYALKEVKGVKTYHGDKYALSFDDSGALTDDCVEEILSIQESADLVTASMQIINGIPDEIIDFGTGEKMKGVRLEVMKGAEGSG